MKISEFFEYNHQDELDDNENILEYLERIFGKSTKGIDDTVGFRLQVIVLEWTSCGTGKN